MSKHNTNFSSSILRIYRAFFYSFDGFKSCYQTEQAFRQELFLCLVLFPVPFFLEISSVEKALMIFTLLQILVAELLNSGIEAVVDRISEERHELSKKAKDIGSAAVFISLFSCGLVWCFIIFRF